MVRKRLDALRARCVPLCLAAALQLPGAIMAADPPGPPSGQSFFPNPVAVPRERAATLPTTPDRLRVEVQSEGDSSRQELASAIRRLPLHELSPAARTRVSEITNSPSLFRRLPTISCRTDPRVYTYFTEHPDVAVSIWRVMGISEMQMRQVSATEYETDLQDGTVGMVSVLHRTPTSRLVLCEGEFKSPLLTKTIRSTGLMHLQTQTWQDRNGKSGVTHTADMFVQFQSSAVETVAKLISPMSFKMADHNFEEVSVFLRMMDEAMSHEPGWVERTASRMEGVLPGADQELLQVAAQVYVDAQRRTLERAGQPVTLDAIRPPVQTASGVEGGVLPR
jgi:hypothetical protein